MADSDWRRAPDAKRSTGADDDVRRCQRKCSVLRSLKDLDKCAIGATDGEIGRVKDLYCDDHAWVTRYLIVDSGSWLASRKC